MSGNWRNEPTRLFVGNLRSTPAEFHAVEALASDREKLKARLREKKEALKEASQGGLPGAIYLSAVQSIDVDQAAEDLAPSPPGKWAALVKGQGRGRSL